MTILINTRVLGTETTGLQRYLRELLVRFPPYFKAISPTCSSGMVESHLWEQGLLPLRRSVDHLLFSPCNSGPIAVSRQVVTIHDVAPIDKAEWFKYKKSTWFRYMTPRLARRVEHIITISEHSKQRLLAHVPMDEKRITVIPNGVDRRFSPQGSSRISQMRHKMNLPEGRYVLCVGTLEPRKNLGRLLQSWAHIVDQVPKDIRLILTGKQDNSRAFAQVAGLDTLPPRVHMTGHAPDELMPALYAGALVFAFPSLYEGFGLPPLEAMACGVPVLTGNKTSLPEVVGNAGLMVDPLDVGQIADGLLRLIEDEALRGELVTKGFERARQFDWDDTAHKTWALLQEIAAQ